MTAEEECLIDWTNPVLYVGTLPMRCGAEMGSVLQVALMTKLCVSTR